MKTQPIFRTFVFPAQAGIILFVALSPFTHVGIPRAGGGDPVDGVTMRDITMYSPRKRG